MCSVVHILKYNSGFDLDSAIFSLSMRVSAFISLALVFVLVLHTVLNDIRLNMSNLPSIYTDHSYTLNICTYHSLSLPFILHYYIITVVVLCGCSEGVCVMFSVWCILGVVCWAVVVSS